MASCIAFPWRFPAILFFHESTTQSLSPLSLSSTSSQSPLTHSILSLSLSLMAPSPEIIFSEIPSDYDSENDTTEKCRKRRLRRIQMRRMKYSRAFQQLQPSPLAQNAEVLGGSKPNLVEQDEEEEESSVRGLPPNTTPDFGLMSLKQGDSLFVKTDFFRSRIFNGRSLHLFAVFDGHGRRHARNLCKNTMHTTLAAELTRVEHTVGPASGDGGGSRGSSSLAMDEWENMVRAALEKAFERMKLAVENTCATWGNSAHTCGCRQPMHLDFVGSGSALVAILAPEHVVVARTGHSPRAVLCRGESVIRLSPYLEHQRLDKLERTLSEDGKLVCENGVHGTLGDNFFNSVQQWQPEISVTERDEAEDECLIMATNGIWEVISDDKVSEVTCRCLREQDAAAGKEERLDSDQMVFSSTSELAAAVLCRLALGRGSCDNVNAIVVDLKSKRF